MGPDHPRWKGGRYSFLYQGRLREYFKKIHLDDTNPLDLLPELEVQRTLLAFAIERLNESESRLETGKLAQSKRTENYMLVSYFAGSVVNTVSKILSARNQTAFTKSELEWLIAKWKEGMEIFVPLENRRPYMEWLSQQLPISEDMD